MDNDAFQSQVVSDFSEFVNPYLGKLMNFAGFGVEMKAEGCVIWDHDGREYLDCLGGYGVFSLGHRHPKVVAAVKAQLDKMPLSSKVLFSEPMTLLAKKLAEITPGNLQYSFFSNSGTEAVECALKFAKGATGRSKIVATTDSYHGKTLGSLSTTGREKYREQFYPLMPGPVHIPFGDVDAIAQCIDDDTAAVIIEPVQGEGGIHIPPAGYLAGIKACCEKHGALLIVDEVQTGFGRTGMMFACEYDGVTPDLLTLAKCLGGGVMPIGATVGTPAIWEKVYSKNPLLHTSTFGGNPLACAAGLAAIQVVEEENLIERSNTMGRLLLEGLEQVQQKYPDTIAEVRGKGLMIGVEFVADEVGELTIAQMTKRGVIAAYTLNNPRVIRFEPPLVITESQVQFACEVFGAAVAETREILAELV